MRSGYAEANESTKQNMEKSTRIVDLRSDTFTQPSPEMREAIYKVSWVMMFLEKTPQSIDWSRWRLRCLAKKMRLLLLVEQWVT